MMVLLNAPGVYLSQRGVELRNNSLRPIADIGVGENALQCITDKDSCCENDVGQWTFPNSSQVPTMGQSTTIYVSRGTSDGAVNLNREDSVMMPTGQYCCMVPDTTGSNLTLCAILGEKTVHTYLSYAQCT